MSKKAYNWMMVRPGDIISFRYKSKRASKSKLQTILVLNPRINLRRHLMTIMEILMLKGNYLRLKGGLISSRMELLI